MVQASAKEKNIKKSTAKKSTAKVVKNKVGILVLPYVADIVFAQELYTQANELVKKSVSHVEINGVDVGRITTPCVQVILSLFKVLKNKNIPCSIKEPSEMMKNAFYDLGFEEEFNEWSEVK